MGRLPLATRKRGTGSSAETSFRHSFHWNSLEPQAGKNEAVLLARTDFIDEKFTSVSPSIVQVWLATPS